MRFRACVNWSWKNEFILNVFCLNYEVENILSIVHFCIFERSEHIWSLIVFIPDDLLIVFLQISKKNSWILYIHIWFQIKWLCSKTLCLSGILFFVCVHLAWFSHKFVKANISFFVDAIVTDDNVFIDVVVDVAVVSQLHWRQNIQCVVVDLHNYLS